MNSKVLVNNNASKLEAEWMNAEGTPMLYFADIIVNPTWQRGLISKTIIIDLPGIDPSKFARYNKIISRFPLDLDGKANIEYELKPFPKVDFFINPSPKKYSYRILNKWLLMDDNVKIESDDRFLLGTEPTTNGQLSLIGYLILKTIKS